MPQDKTVITPVEIITPKQQEKRNPWRPTKYNAETVGKVYAYLEIEKDKEKSFPTIEGLARYLEVDTDQINKWYRKRVKDDKGNKTKELFYPEFHGAINKLKSFQKEKLIVDGFYGGKSVNVNMAIFLLKVNHGMIETNHTDLTTKGEKVTPLLGGGANVPVNDGDK